MKKIIVMLMCLICTSIFADTYSSKPVKIIVPWPAGGATDYVARLYGEQLSKALNQSVVIDNRAGAMGNIGAWEVSKSSPDGNTLLLTISDALINNSALFKNLNYNSKTDFVLVGQIVKMPVVLYASSSSGLKTFNDFRTSNKQIKNYGSWGVGSSGHLIAESLVTDLRLETTHIPYRGELPVVNDLLNQTLDIGMASVSSGLQQVRVGNIVPLAVSGPVRIASMPTVPTFNELGFDNALYKTNVWMGVLTPAGTPPEITARLNHELRIISEMPEIKAKLAERGAIAMSPSLTEAKQNFDHDHRVITSRIKNLKLELQ